MTLTASVIPEDHLCAKLLKIWKRLCPLKKGRRLTDRHRISFREQRRFGISIPGSSVRGIR
jgi:hypothetical protein